MDFDLSEEHKMIRDMARKFAQEVIAPRSEELERTGKYPYDIMDQMAELGIMGHNRHSCLSIFAALSNSQAAPDNLDNRSCTNPSEDRGNRRGALRA